MTFSTPVYPNGRGHFALGEPDGPVLRQDMKVLLLLAGQQISGVIRWSERGDFFEAALDQSVCGLYPSMRVALVRKQYSPRFHWTTSRQHLLMKRYLELSVSASLTKRNGLYAVGRRIAEEQRWPVQAVWSKLYQLRQELTRQRQMKEQQRRTIALLLQRNEQAPIVLKQDIHLWTVMVGSERRSWLLSYVYGECPLLPGQRCMYEEQLYRIERVWTTQLNVSRVDPASPFVGSESHPGRERVLW